MSLPLPDLPHTKVVMLTCGDVVEGHVFHKPKW